ncbi:MAG: CoB--CoM heterodisulfide reductase iron-sulfur subunit B family protein [Planctomycetes bacterium]|nr:CoB--CoM heterodisulfide reductase iron-sulfur subunit B family protein [Planctomycetota bacterium]MBU4400848.1 CoB--CoM heterodisulfide reductase iron-sulfur subunit B family protein [Planctomycetota bacterium]MCG2685102.1 CoB--CoM heterodisulfide reductase iron-sulfur subunit B family protein [Planctomycetales bacterium]
MKYAYYPGCSLERNAAAYDHSVREVADLLGIRLQEIDDWNCCGATEYFSRNELAACAVIARNLALVEPQTDQLVAPCAACYLNLIKTDKLMVDHPEFGKEVNQCLAAGGLKYEPGRVTVRHMLDVIVDDIGETAVRDKVVRPLAGLRVAPYYGCQVVRPISNNDNPEYPMKMDHLLKWLGAEVVDYPVKAHCCGGHMTQISEPQAFELIRRLLQNAQDYVADMIVCMCPMCQLNLDGYQSRVNGFFGTEFKLPIMYFTQMLGIAFGIDPQKLGFGKEIVTAMPVLEAKLGGQPV